MIQTDQIKEHMEVVGSDGQHVGIVDHVVILLTKSDPAAHGKHHVLRLEKVEGAVDGKLRLSIPATEAIQSLKELTS